MMLASRMFAAAISMAATAALTGSAQAQTLESKTAVNSDLRAGFAAIGPTLRRVIEIGEIGFADGFQFSGLNGERELFFPVIKDAATDMTFRLDLRSQSAFASRRTLQILIDDRVVATRGLDSEAESFTIRQAVDAGSVENGFVKVTLRYTGAITEDRCVDQRVAGDFLTVLPSSALAVTLDPTRLTTIDAVLAMMPRDIAVRLPDRDLDEAEMAALIRIHAALAQGGASVTHIRADAAATSVGSWSTGTIVLGADAVPADASTAPATASAGGTLSVLAGESGPALLVAGPKPQIAAELLASRWQALALGPSLSVMAASESGSAARSATSFADLGIPLASAQLVDQVVFDATFRVADLPANTRPTQLDLDLGVATDTRGSDVTIAAFLNNYLLASTTSPAGAPVTLSAAIPDGLVGRDNAIRVLAQRQPATGDCANPPQGFPLQLLPTSRIVTAALDRPAADFFEMATIFKSDLTVYMPQQGAASAGRSAALVAGMLAADTPLTVRFGDPDPAPGTPFIIVSSTRPDGVDSPVRFDQGRVRLSDAAGTPLVDVGGLDDHTSVQIVRAGEVSGLWIRPGDTGPVVAAVGPVALDRGDVAILDEEGVAFAFSSTRDQLVAVTYPDRMSLVDMARQYWPWIVGALWILGTLVFVTILSRMYRRRRAG